MVTREKALAIALTLLMVTAAGCAGWGTDGPADEQDQDQNQSESDDVEEADGETQADGGDSNDDEDASDSTDSRDGDSGDETDTSAPTGDENTDATGSTEDGDPASDSDSDGDSEIGDSDANDGTDGDDSGERDPGAGDGDQDTGDGDGDGDDGDDGGESDEPETHTLTVTVLDHEDNRLSNASVSVVIDPGTGGGEDVGSATTNESGVAEFEVEDGAYEISASHDDYQADGVTGPVTVQGEDTSVGVAMPGSDDGNGDEDPETHTLTVNLANHDIDGIAVTVERDGGPDEDPESTTKASAGGQVSFHGLEPGLYYAEAEGYNPTMVGIEVDEDTEITLQKPSPDPIQVTVVDAETGEAIEGAEISGMCDLWHSSGDEYITGETDANGVAQAQTGVAPTDCNARVDANGYEPTDVSLSVPDDDGITVELTPADDGEDGTATGSETTMQAMTSSPA